MSDGDEFESFPSISRLSRQCVVTEKIDGTNAQVFVGDDGVVRAGSRRASVGEWMKARLKYRRLPARAQLSRLRVKKT